MCLRFYQELNGFSNHVFDKLVELKLLSNKESERLRAMEFGSPSSECLLWILAELLDEMNNGVIKPPIYRAIENKVP